MSETWTPRRFDELVEFHDHNRVPLSKRERAQRSGPYPYYGAQGIIDWLDGYLFDGRYLLIAEDGENLNSRKMPVSQIADGRFWVNNHAHVVRALPGVADEDFLRVAIEFHPLNGLITGAAQPKLSQANLRRLELVAPEYGLQQQIGEVIRALDGLIENNKQRIAILEQTARLIYREWFVHFRFPGYEDVELVDSDLGPIPSNWKVQALSDAVELAYGKALKADLRRGGEVAVYGSGGIVGWHDTALVEGPGVVLGRKGNVGAVYWSDVDFYPIDTTYFVKTELPLLWVYHLLQTLEFLDSHAAVPGLSREQAYGLKVVLPGEQLAAFNDVVNPMYELRRNLLAQNDVLSRSRDLLLPRLIFGELDVSDLDLDLEPVA